MGHLLIQKKTRVTKNPIKVYKVLEKTKDGYRTPVRRWLLREDKVFKQQLNINEQGITNSGILVFNSFLKAYLFKLTYPTLDLHIFNAIIPKFSNYAIDIDGNIVANKVIIKNVPYSK